MTEIPPFVAGSTDERGFAISVPGIGRDGDHVLPDAPVPAAIAALLAGIAGVAPIAPGGGRRFRRALGLAPVRFGGSEAGKVYAVPRAHLAARLAGALVQFGASDVAPPRARRRCAAGVTSAHSAR